MNWNFKSNNTKAQPQIDKLKIETLPQNVAQIQVIQCK